MHVLAGTTSLHPKIIPPCSSITESRCWGGTWAKLQVLSLLVDSFIIIKCLLCIRHCSGDTILNDVDQTSAFMITLHLQIDILGKNGSYGILCVLQIIDNRIVFHPNQDIFESQWHAINKMHWDKWEHTRRAPSKLGKMVTLSNREIMRVSPPSQLLF